MPIAKTGLIYFRFIVVQIRKKEKVLSILSYDYSNGNYYFLNSFNTQDDKNGICSLLTLVVTSTKLKCDISHVPEANRKKEWEIILPAGFKK